MDIEYSFSIKESYFSTVNHYKSLLKFEDAKSMMYPNTAGSVARISASKDTISISCDEKNYVEKTINYIKIIRVYEIKEGVILLFTKHRFLFIPISDLSSDERIFWKLYLKIREEEYGRYKKIESLATQNKINRLYKVKRIADRRNLEILVVYIIACYMYLLSFAALIYYGPFYIMDEEDAILIHGKCENIEIEKSVTGRYATEREYFNITLDSGEELMLPLGYLSGEEIKVLKSIKKGTFMDVKVGYYDYRVCELEVNGKKIADYNFVQTIIAIDALLFMILDVLGFFTAGYILLELSDFRKIFKVS